MLTHTNGQKQHEGKKSVSIHSHGFERSYKLQKVTDTKSCNVSHNTFLIFPKLWHEIFSSGILKVLSRILKDYCLKRKTASMIPCLNGFSQLPVWFLWLGLRLSSSNGWEFDETFGRRRPRVRAKIRYCPQINLLILKYFKLI